MIVAYVLCV